MPRIVYAVYYPEAGGLVFRAVLGSGLDGTASLVQQVTTRNLVVRKVISPKMSTEDAADHPEVRYYRSHPHIPRLIATNTATRSTIIVSSYCNGGSVSQFHSQQQTLNYAEILIWRMLSDVLSAITTLHRSEPSVLHRDIHTGNIFIHWPSEQHSLPRFLLGDLGRAQDAASFGAPSHQYKACPQAKMSTLLGSRMAADIFNLATSARALMTETGNYHDAAQMRPQPQYSPALHAVLSSMVIKSRLAHLEATPLRFYTWDSYDKTVKRLQQEIDQKLVLLEAKHVGAAWQIVPEPHSPLYFASKCELLSYFKEKKLYPPGTWQVAQFRVSDSGISELLKTGEESYVDIDGRLCQQTPGGDSWEWTEVAENGC